MLQGWPITCLVLVSLTGETTAANNLQHERQQIELKHEIGKVLEDELAAILSA